MTDLTDNDIITTTAGPGSGDEDAPGESGKDPEDNDSPGESGKDPEDK